MFFHCVFNVILIVELRFVPRDIFTLVLVVSAVYAATYRVPRV